MKNILRVARWEFSSTLKNKQFILFTTIFPLMVLGFGFLSALLSTPDLNDWLGNIDQKHPSELIPGQPPEIWVPMVTGGIFASIFLFVVLFSGTFVLQTIVREKQSRVVEILLAAVSPRDMISGKILAFGALGIVQTLIWVGVGLIALLLLGPYAGLPVWPILTLLLTYMPWSTLLLFAIYFILGYLFISSLSAGMGATMTDVLSGQQVQSLIIALPSALPLMIFTIIVTNPNGLLPSVLSYIPPTIAGTMMLRLAFTQIPAWEIATTLLILFVSIVVVMRLAGKVFEVGILMYGKSATLKEIWRWMRS